MTKFGIRLRKNGFCRRRVDKYRQPPPVGDEFKLDPQHESAAWQLAAKTRTLLCTRTTFVVISLDFVTPL